MGHASSSIWKRSFSNREALQGMPPRAKVETMLFGAAGHLGELCDDLKGAPGEPQGETLRALFADIRGALA